MEKLPKKWKVKVTCKEVVDYARENLCSEITSYASKRDSNKYLCVDTEVKDAYSSYNFLTSSDIRFYNFIEITLEQFKELVPGARAEFIRTELKGARNWATSWYDTLKKEIRQNDIYSYLIDELPSVKLYPIPVKENWHVGNPVPYMQDLLGIRKEGCRDVEDSLAYKALHFNHTYGSIGLDFSDKWFTTSDNITNTKRDWYPFTLDESFKKQEEMKVTDVKQLSVGDIIRIEKDPMRWSSHFCSRMYAGSYPLTVKIEDMCETDGEGGGNIHNAMTCGVYGWSLDAIVKKGCTLISKANNMKDKRFPFKLKEEDAKRVINVACSTWYQKLLDKWSAKCFLDGYVIIEEDFYKEMRKACTPDQNVVFDDIFGEDVKEAKYKEGDWVYCGKETETWDSVVQLTKDVKNGWAYATTKQGNEQNFTAGFIIRKATQEEINKAMCPYEDGELCFVRSKVSNEWLLAYSMGITNNIGMPLFYGNQQKQGPSGHWTYHQSAKGIKLPKIK